MVAPIFLTLAGLGLSRFGPMVWNPGSKIPWYIRVGKAYQKFNKKMETFGPLGYGAMYASGTVLGYQGTSQFFKPKWKYLGSPQRVSKL